MRRRAVVAGVVLASTLSIGVARAEMEDRGYATTSPALDADEAERVRRRIADEVAREAERAHERARRDAEAERLAAEARAARPLGVRLVEDRCTACHGLERIEATRYGRLSWHFTVVRMRLVNGARLDDGEAWAVAEHLHDVHRASLSWQILEWVALLAVVATPVAILRLSHRRRAARTTVGAPDPEA